jgi:hypothetical protein
MQRLVVSGAVRPLYGSLGLKGLTNSQFLITHLYVFTAGCSHELNNFFTACVQIHRHAPHNDASVNDGPHIRR